MWTGLECPAAGGAERRGRSEYSAVQCRERSLASERKSHTDTGDRTRQRSKSNLAPVVKKLKEEEEEAMGQELGMDGWRWRRSNPSEWLLRASAADWAQLYGMAVCLASSATRGPSRRCTVAERRGGGEAGTGPGGEGSGGRPEPSDDIPGLYTVLGARFGNEKWASNTGSAPLGTARSRI